MICYLLTLSCLLLTTFSTECYSKPPVAIPSSQLPHEQHFLEIRKYELTQNPEPLVILESKWRMGQAKLLASGFEGKVYQVKGDAGEYAAVKKLTIRKNLKKLNTGNIVHLHIPKHKHIVSIRFLIVRDRRDKKFSYLIPDDKLKTITKDERKNYFISAIIMDLVEGIELFELCHSSKSSTHFKNNEERIALASDMTLQLCKAIQHLHENGITHRDIKPENIIINLATKHLTLVDFGLCTKKLRRMRKMYGTPGYVAPEMDGIQDYSYAVDLWSLGSVLFTYFFQQEYVHMYDHEALEGSLKYQLEIARNFSLLSDEDKEKEYMKLCRREQLYIPPYLLDIVSGLTRLSPKKRLKLLPTRKILEKNTITAPSAASHICNML